MSASKLARQRSLSKSKRPPQILVSQPKGKGRAVDLLFEPCAATASLFLYSQGSTILCLHHDTLAVERRFQNHGDDIRFISVDNVSERGAGRLVVSYDFSLTAIVWDLFESTEVARFASYEPLTVASWMRNGNVAFGTTRGEIILFEPSSSEHISARTIFDPITALAPASDCKTYAIGYNNGSILLAALKPAFTILHTLSTSRGPSPIAALSWHASSSKQKSDMLATQTSDGDLRVWSVAKPPTGDVPRVIRGLKRSDTFVTSHNWISWSKNGRIVQYSEKETWSWDVRTKHVTYEPIPTIEDVRALACYGPTATLFTLGPNYTVQQYDLSHPQMVANVQYLPAAVPPTPPEMSTNIAVDTSESDGDLSSPIRRATNEVMAMTAAQIERAQSASPRSVPSRQNSVSSRTSSSKGQHEETPSPAAKTERSGTTFSQGAQAQYLKEPLLTGNSLYSSVLSPVSTTRSLRKGSRLRQEVLPSPEDKPLRDLFPYIRARLSDVPYKPLRPFEESHLTPDDLRKQMLNVVFGWEEDIEDLIRDELSRHPMGSQNAVLLSKWLDDDPDHMATMIGAGGTPSNLDWMMLALGGLGKQAQSKKVAHAFVEKMLAKGDIHAATTILLSLGDRNDAIEVYVTRSHFMEAILLACLVLPTDWQRQSFLVRKWGEHVVENSQQHLAIRCFACTGVEPTDPWTSPTAQMAAMFPERVQTVQGPYRRQYLEAPTPVAMPPPPNAVRYGIPNARMTTKTSSLKLITSFGSPSPADFRFPGLKSDDRTPTNAPGVTPIAESAVGESATTPGGLGSYRMNNVRSINSALSTRTAIPSGYPRNRLPSIGETPIDVSTPLFAAPKPLPTPVDSGSDKDKDAPVVGTTPQMERETDSGAAVLVLSSAKYHPIEPSDKMTPLTAVAPPAAVKLQISERPSSSLYEAVHIAVDESTARNGSHGRRPDNLSIQMIPVEESDEVHHINDPLDFAALVQESDTVAPQPATVIDTQSERMSPPTTGYSFRSNKSPSVSGKSIDQYINSVDEAQYYSRQHRTRRQENQDQVADGSRDDKKRTKHRTRAPSEEGRGRSSRRVIAQAKRSPSSPVPMSPEELALHNASFENFDTFHQPSGTTFQTKTEDGQKQRKGSSAKSRSTSKTGERHHHKSRSRQNENKSKTSSRAVNRLHSTDVNGEAHSRGSIRPRRERSALRSPISPVPMSPSSGEVDKPFVADQALRLVSNDRQRRQTSNSCRAQRGTSAARDPSPDRRMPPARSSSRQAQERSAGPSRRGSLGNRGGSTDYGRRRERSADPHPAPEWPPLLEPPTGSESNPQLSSVGPDSRSVSDSQFRAEQRRKELAAAELEARRASLARRLSAPTFPLPGQAATHNKSSSLGTQSQFIGANTETSPPTTNVSSFAGRMQARTSSSEQSASDSASSGRAVTNPRVGLPATPRAMRHPKYSDAPHVTEVPENLIPLVGDSRNHIMEAEQPRSMSAPIPEYDSFIPGELPKHPAFDRRLPTSRSNSKTPDRGASPGRKRELSRERLFISPPQSSVANTGARSLISPSNVELPPILPELQHLVTPPPPPPPPPLMPHHEAVPGGGPVSTGERSHAQSTAVSPSMATPAQDSSSEHTSSRHRRHRSANEKFVGKMKSMVRLRSTSRPRNAQSPTPDRDMPSPYESIPPRSIPNIV